MADDRANAQNAQHDSDKKKELKEYFSDGKIPTGAHFEKLITAFVLTEALDAAEKRIDNLEHPENGKFEKSITLGSGADAWKIQLENGALEFNAQKDNPAAWLKMPARVGSVPRDPATESLATIRSLNLQSNLMNGRNLRLVSPGPGPFAIEVVASLTPDKVTDPGDEEKKGFLSRLLAGLLAPPEAPVLVRAVALSAGEGLPAKVDQQATPLTNFRTALARNVLEFLLFAALMLFMGDKINTEIQQIAIQDDWFEKSFELPVSNSLICPVAQALAAAKLYNLPEGRCPEASGDANKDGDGKPSDEANSPTDSEVSKPDSAQQPDTQKKPDGGTGQSDPDKSADADANSDWLQQLTGESPKKPEAPVNAGAASPAASAGANVAAPNQSAGQDTANPADGTTDTPLAASPVSGGFKMAYSILGSIIGLILLFLWLRSVPMWLAMRRGLAVLWVKDAKAAGGITLVVRRRGKLPTPTATVYCHMTQLWG